MNQASCIDTNLPSCTSQPLYAHVCGPAFQNQSHQRTSAFGYTQYQRNVRDAATFRRKFNEEPVRRTRHAPMHAGVQLQAYTCTVIHRYGRTYHSYSNSTCTQSTGQLSVTARAPTPALILVTFNARAPRRPRMRADPGAPSHPQTPTPHSARQARTRRAPASRARRTHRRTTQDALG